jgi:hypothetical protein
MTTAAPIRNPGLRVFAGFLSDFRSLFGLTSKGLLLAPFASILIQTGPPWPGSSTTLALTGLTELAVLLTVFETSRRTPSMRAIRIFGAGALAALIVYLALHSYLVFSNYAGVPDVRGFAVQGDLRAKFGPLFTEEKALSGAGFVPFRVYAPWSIHLARLSLVVDWLVVTAMTAALFASLAIRLRGSAREKGHKQ